jgi:hypothetical protein
MENMGDAIGLFVWITLVPVLIALALRSRHHPQNEDAPPPHNDDDPPPAR